MPSIVTITFNPALDKSTTINALVPEKKLRCTKPVVEPGGGGINVARVIKRLGGDATALYLKGGFNGILLHELLDAEGITSLAVAVQEGTRENVVVYDESTNQQYRFCMPGPVVSTQEWQQCIRVIEELQNVQYFVVSGTLPPGIPVEIYATIAAIAKSKNAKLVADTSGEALQLAVEEGVYLLKPNIGELSALVGKESLDIQSVRDIAKHIIAKGKCEVIVISMGAAGALLVTKDVTKQIYAPLVKRISTVGAGDSMLAGIVQSLITGKSIIEATAFGVACGTAATMNAGTELCRREDVDRLYDDIVKTL